MKAKFFSIFYLALALTGVANPSARAADDPTEPAATDIVKQSLAKYESLTSYSDEGVVVATLGPTIGNAYTFTLKLARTNFYQVLWRSPDDLHAPKGVAWSAGKGDYVWLNPDLAAAKQPNRDQALTKATRNSVGVAASVPGTFFNLHWSDLLRTHQAEFTRAADDKVGDVDCFVLTHSADGRGITVWIGKQDRLLHQIENDTSGKVVRAALEAQAQKDPKYRALLDQPVQDVKSIETHRNIVLNPELTAKDFEFNAPGANQP